MFSRAQRVALYNLCTIQNLTFYEPEMRAASLALRKMIVENTLDPKSNACSFDLSDDENKKLDKKPIRTSAQKYANS